MQGLTVWLEEDAAEAVRREAAARGVSVSALLRQRLMREYPIPWTWPKTTETQTTGSTDFPWPAAVLSGHHAVEFRTG